MTAIPPYVLKVQKYLDFAREHGMKMRGHTLVWHNQTPGWFSQKGTAGRGCPLRTGDYIAPGWRVYPSGAEFTRRSTGIIYAWDVVMRPEDGAALFVD